MQMPKTLPPSREADLLLANQLRAIAAELESGQASLSHYSQENGLAHVEPDENNTESTIKDTGQNSFHFTLQRIQIVPLD